MTKEEVIKQIESFSVYENVTEEIVKQSKNLITSLSEEAFLKITDVYPNPHGTISFEFANDQSQYVSIEIGDDLSSYYESTLKGYKSHYIKEWNDEEIKLINHKILNP